MSSHSDDYLDGNAAAGELSTIFALDITAAKGECANCGAMRRFAEVHLYTPGLGFVARCPQCQNVLLRLVHIEGRMLLDLRGTAQLIFDV